MSWNKILTTLVARVAKMHDEKIFQNSIYKIPADKQHHLKVLLDSFHLSGYTQEFHQQTWK